MGSGYRIALLTRGPVNGLRMAVLPVLLAAAGTPLAAQKAPVQPNAVRTQVNQPARTGSAAPVQQAPAPRAATGPAAQTRPVAAAQNVVRRDPFDPLVGKDKNNSSVPERLPPGKAGLLIATLRVDGIVRAPSGMIAIVSNPQQRVYFLREGDRLYDGQVANITLEAVSFHQAGKDPFGAPIERNVTKRLYPIPGEQP